MKSVVFCYSGCCLTKVRSLVSSETVIRCTDHARVSQGSVLVVMHQRWCGEIFSDCFIANFPEIVLVKEFSKSVNIR